MSCDTNLTGHEHSVFFPAMIFVLKGARRQKINRVKTTGSAVISFT